MLIFPAMDEQLYSIRMHASRSGEHVSGAENLVSARELPGTAANLVRRAMGHTRGPAEELRVAIERIEPGCLGYAGLPDLTTLSADSVAAARQLAVTLLARAGVAPAAAADAMRHMSAGAAPGGVNMRGAMLVDSRTGERLETDRSRGVRVSRIGMTRELAELLSSQLTPLGLDNEHVREALVLAGKVALHEDIVAELCWSDDPDYTAGYVCSRRFGYLRFTHLKPAGELRGGRAFFVRPGSDLQALTTWLETSPILFNRTGACSPPVDGRTYAAALGSGTENT